MLGDAWLASVIALALHVADEATHDFLGWYNPRALRIRFVLGVRSAPILLGAGAWLWHAAGQVH